MTNDDPLMDDEAVGESVLRYLDEHPELLRDMEPGHDLWPGIESRIAPRVLPLTSRPAAALHATRRHFTWIPMAAAAAALVVSTAGITYVITRHTAMQPGAAPAVAGITAAPATGDTAPASDESANVAANVAPTARATDGGSATPPAAPHAAVRAVPAPAPGARLASRGVPSERDEIRSDYDREITTLRAALDARRTELDPATVATVEQNLQVIDNAIRQARAALQKDPKSRFLNNQLDRTLAKKTDLLRAAALLPSA